MSVSGSPSSSGASSPPPVKPAAPSVKPSSTSNSGGNSGSGASTVSKPTPSNSTTSTNNNPPVQPSSKAASKDLPDTKSSTGPDKPSQSSDTRPDPLRQDPRDTSGRVQLAMASPTARGTTGKTSSDDSPTETLNSTAVAKKPVTLTSFSTTSAVLSPVAKSVAEPVKPPTAKEPDDKSKEGKDTSTASGGTSKLVGITTSAPVSIEVKEKATKLGLDPKTLETLSPADQVKMLAQAGRAVDIGLKPDATEDAIAKKIKDNALFTAGSANANADDAARLATNKEVATLKAAKASGADKLTEVPTTYKSTVQDEVAARLRIDTRGKTPDAVAKEIQARTARLNGMDPAKAAGMSTDDLKASNRRASLDWLAKQGLSGIKPDATGAYPDVTHEQMLAGYRAVYGMDKNATWADVQQKWQERNATVLADRIQRENLGQSPTDYYRGIAGLPTAVRTVPDTPTPGGTGGAPPGTASVNKRPMIAVLDDFTVRTIDLNGDMITKNPDGSKSVDFSKADLSHGNAVIGFLKDRGVSEADIFRLDANQAGVEPGRITDVMIQAQLNGLIRGKDGKDPFLSRVETLNMSFERSLTFDQLGTLLQNGQPALRADLAGALKALQDPKTTNPEAARTLVRDELYKLSGSPAAGPAGPLS
ncbi:MAG: hypothetical protein K2X66_12375 [Cyanobacteria bacterium]|nr:hypothetical protein [Cyanobacteriota bacterium]